MPLFKTVFIRAFLRTAQLNLIYRKDLFMPGVITRRDLPVACGHLKTSVVFSALHIASLSRLLRKRNLPLSCCSSTRVQKQPGSARRWPQHAFIRSQPPIFTVPGANTLTRLHKLVEELALHAVVVPHDPWLCPFYCKYLRFMDILAVAESICCKRCQDFSCLLCAASLVFHDIVGRRPSNNISRQSFISLSILYL